MFPGAALWAALAKEDQSQVDDSYYLGQFRILEGDPLWFRMQIRAELRKLTR